MIKLPYVEQGDATGVPVVMLHGVTDSWRSFEPVLPHLPDDIRAIAVTCRGHGDAPKPERGYLIEDLAGDVVGLLDELEIERAILVGHSMGSWVARQIAIDHPDRVLGLVLAGAFQASLAGDPEAAAAMRELADVPDPVPDEVARVFQVSTLASPIAPELLDTFVAESLKLPAQAWRELFLGFAELDQPDGAEELRMPALLVWGDRDAFIPREVQDELIETLPDARLRVYEGVGHAVHWERPKRFAADVAAFSRCSAGLPLSR
jgi:pimeloyl-ACP methyl ester carboxylesterase